MSTVEEATHFSEEIDNAKNKKSVHCQFCNSIMLKPQSGKYLETQVRTIPNIYFVYTTWGNVCGGGCAVSVPVLMNQTHAR